MLYWVCSCARPDEVVKFVVAFLGAEGLFGFYFGRQLVYLFLISGLIDCFGVTFKVPRDLRWMLE